MVVHLIDAQSHIDAEGREGTAADRRSAEDTETIIANLKATDTKVILALNKIDGMRRDKKSRGDLLRFVVLDGIGRPGMLEVPDTSLLFAAYQEIAS